MARNRASRYRLTARACYRERAKWKSSTATLAFWIAARAYGVDQAAAHTSPVYVQIDDQGFWCIEKVSKITAAMRERLMKLATLTPTLSEELEPWELGGTLAAMWHDQRAHIQQRTQKALSV